MPEVALSNLQNAMAQISCDKMQTKVAARKNVNTLDGSVGQTL